MGVKANVGNAGPHPHVAHVCLRPPLALRKHSGMRTPLLAALALIVLVACSQDELLQKFSSQEDQATAKSYIDQLRARKFDEIEKALDPGIRTGNIRDTLTKMAELIPSQEPISIKLVGAHKFQGPNTTTVSTTFEYSFGDKWLLTNVAVRDRNGSKTIVGFNVNPMTQSLESQNRFSLAGKSVLHYTILVAAMAAALLTLYSLLVCARTKPLKRKWLWVLFILVGFGKLAVNWTTGEWGIAPLSVQLFSASAFAPLYGPWRIAVSLPLGALVFLAYRRSRLARPES